MAGINISFASDVRSFLKGTGDAEKGLEDVADALDDLVREAQGAGDGIGEGVESGAEDAEDSLKNLATFMEGVAEGIQAEAREAGRDLDRGITDGAKDAEDAAEKLEKTFRETFDAAKKESKDAGDAIGKSTKDGFTKAGEGAEEFKNEANSTARESAASFDGSAESIADSFQEVAANAFAGFGPAGAVAGLAVAAGLGVAVSKLTDLSDKINEAKEEMGDLALEIRDADGALGEVDFAGKVNDWLVELQDTKSWFEVWQKDAVNNFENVSAAAEKAGVPVEAFLKTLYNPDTNADTFIKSLRDQQEAIESRMMVGQENYGELRKESEAIDTLVETIEDEVDQRKEAEDLALRMQAAENGVTVAVQEQENAIEARNDEMEEAADLVRGVIDSELDYLDTLDSATTKLAENADAGFAKNTAAGRDNLRTLAEISDATLEYADATEESTGSVEKANAVIAEGRQKVIDAGKALGMTQAQAEDYATSLGLIPKEVSTKAKADTASAQSELESLAAPRTAHVDVTLNTTRAEAEMRAFLRDRYSTVRTQFTGLGGSRPGQKED